LIAEVRGATKEGRKTRSAGHFGKGEALKVEREDKGGAYTLQPLYRKNQMASAAEGLGGRKAMGKGKEQGKGEEKGTERMKVQGRRREETRSHIFLGLERKCRQVGGESTREENMEKGGSGRAISGGREGLRKPRINERIWVRGDASASSCPPPERDSRKRPGKGRGDRKGKGDALLSD